MLAAGMVGAGAGKGSRAGIGATSDRGRWPGASASDPQCPCSAAARPPAIPQAVLYVGRALNGAAEGLLMTVFVGAVEVANK
jgi:hypothetical protein